MAVSMPNRIKNSSKGSLWLKCAKKRKNNNSRKGISSDRLRSGVSKNRRCLRRICRDGRSITHLTIKEASRNHGVYCLRAYIGLIRGKGSRWWRQERWGRRRCTYRTYMRGKQEEVKLGSTVGCNSSKVTTRKITSTSSSHRSRDRARTGRTTQVTRIASPRHKVSPSSNPKRSNTQSIFSKHPSTREQTKPVSLPNWRKCNTRTSSSNSRAVPQATAPTIWESYKTPKNNSNQS